MLKPDSLTATPSGPLTGDALVPGDKSMSHRALILGALASGETRIHGLLESLDVLGTASAVESFGAAVERLSDGSWKVEGRPWRSPDGPVDCGNSGTTARLVMGASAGFPVTASFTGDESLRERPMRRVLDPLRQMGAQLLEGDGNRLPVTLRGGGLNGLSYCNNLGSAQVKSAILLAGLRASGEVEVIEPRPSRDHSERMLEKFGCEIDFGSGFARLGERRELRGRAIEVPADPSSAAFPIVAALLVPGSRVRVANVHFSPLRAGLYRTLAEMGANLYVEGGESQTAFLTASHSPLRGVEVPAGRVPSMVDEYPVLAVAAAFANGRTIMRGLSELRVKESDRLSAMAEALRACGVEARTDDDDLIVEGLGGPPPGNARIEARGDHRIAMSMLVLGLATRSPVSVDSASAIATSFPGFAEAMAGLGASVE